LNLFDVIIMRDIDVHYLYYHWCK